VDEHPVAGLHAALVVEEADIHIAPYTRNLDAGQPVGLIDELDHLTWDRQAHTHRAFLG
jgi:hypothetical protein